MTFCDTLQFHVPGTRETRRSIGYNGGMTIPTTLPSPRPRAKTGLYITQRDQAVMSTLARYQLLREATLHALCFPTVAHQRHVQAILKRLSDHGYIGRRFLPPVHRINTEYLDYTHQDRGGALYFLLPAGGVIIGRTAKPAVAKINLPFLHHRLDIADIRACLELALRSFSEGGRLELAHWIDEHEKDEAGVMLLADRVTFKDEATGRTERISIRPDACFILRDQALVRRSLGEGGTGQEECFFVEVDEGTESVRRRWRNKVLAYRAYARQGFKERFVFQGQGFRVLTITRTPTGREQGKRKANLVAATAQAGGRKQFYFATFDQLMPEGRPTGAHILHSPIWQRADNSTVCLSE